MWDSHYKPLYSHLRLQLENSSKIHIVLSNTEDDVYSGDLYSGNDGYSGLNPPDDAILFTVSGITAIADKNLEIFYQNLQSSGSSSTGKIDIFIKISKLFVRYCGDSANSK